MSIVLVGLSHKTAPVELRERVAFDEPAVTDALGSLADQRNMEECLIVSTCNRVELLGSAPENPRKGIERLTEFLCDYHGLPADSIRGHLYSHVDGEAVKHTFRVASSLDSLVVGESQILGQVKDAYNLAIKAGTVGRVLSQLMHQAIRVAKRVRSETGIARQPVSISSVAVELAHKVFGELSNNTVLLVGAGEMGELAARKLMEEGTGKLIVTNRTAGNAEEIARQFGGGAVNIEALYDVLPSANIVICSTGAPDYVIRATEVRRALKSRRKGPLLFIDISVPRNVDPAVADLDDSFLFDVDDLESIVESNISERAREAKEAEAIVALEVEQFLKRLQSLDVGPSVAEIKQLLADIAISEFNRNRKSLGPLTGEQEAAIANILIPRLVNKLSHPLIIHIREAARNGQQAKTLEELRKLVRLD